MKKDLTNPPKLSKLLHFAFPVIVSQATETLMMFVDRLFLSWISKSELAAAMSGGLSSFVFTAFFIGLIGYVNPLVAQYYGAGKPEKCVQTVSQGVWLSFLFYPLALGLIPLVKWSFILAGHSASQIELEYSYFRILMLGAILMMLRNAFAGFFLGLGKTKVVLWANFFGMLLNIPLNYLFIFGVKGIIPAMGIQGAAYGTLGGSLLITLILLGFYLSHHYYKEYGNRSGWAMKSALMRKLLKFGWPAGAELFLNVLAFNIFLQLMHSYSTDVAAAITIVFNFDLLAFIPMVGLGIAITSMVGQRMGAEDSFGAEKVVYLGLKTGYAYAGAMMLLFIFQAPFLVRIFSRGMDVSDAGLLDMAAVFLRLAAIYTLADVTSLVFSGGLRGAGDTRAVLIISSLMHWGMALLSVIGIRFLSLPPIAIWVIFIFTICLNSIFMFLRFKLGPWKSIRLVNPAE